MRKERGKASEIVGFMGRMEEVQREKGLPITNFLLPIEGGLPQMKADGHRWNKGRFFA